MTPKEKAIELVDKFADYTQSYMEDKQCALIAVDEELNFLVDKFDAYVWSELNQFLHDRINYLHKLKTEIEKL